MNQKVFITGAAGFVGANITRLFLQKGYDVHVAVRQSGSLWRISDISKKIIIHEGILLDSKKLHAVLSKIQPNVIIHLASYGAYPIQQDWNQMVQTNVLGLKNLLDATLDIPYASFVISGSSSEYGYKDVKMSEDDYIEPNSLYAVTKATATHLGQFFAKTNHKPISIFRFFNVYGYWEEKGRLVRSVIEHALKNEPIELATGKEARDFVFVEDVAQAFLKTIEGKKALEGEVFNLGSGKQTTIYQLSKKVVSLISSKSTIELGIYPGRSWDAFYWKADTMKSARVLRWKAQTSLEEGLKKTIAWYRKNLELKIKN